LRVLRHEVLTTAQEYEDKEKYCEFHFFQLSQDGPPNRHCAEVNYHDRCTPHSLSPNYISPSFLLLVRGLGAASSGERRHELVQTKSYFDIDLNRDWVAILAPRVKLPGTHSFDRFLFETHTD
jgi:hypothetical protein